MERSRSVACLGVNGLGSALAMCGKACITMIHSVNEQMVSLSGSREGVAKLHNVQCAALVKALNLARRADSSEAALARGRSPPPLASRGLSDRRGPAQS